MKLLLYSHPFAPQVGGLERLTERTAEMLGARGLQVDVVTDTPFIAGQPALTPGHYTVHRRPSLWCLWRLVRHADLVQLNSFDVCVWAIATFLRRPLVWQHVDYHTVCPRGTCMRSGEPCTFAVRRCWTCLRTDHPRLGALRVLAAFMTKAWAARTVGCNVVASDYAARRLGVRKATFLRLGIDTTNFVPREQPGEGTQDPLLVVFSGRHIEGKGCDVLIRALATCAARGLPVLAAITGDGPTRANTEALANRLGISERVEFRGFVSDAELIELIGGAGAVVVPAIHDEYYGLAAAEAMSCGVPVVASAIGSLPEVVGSGGVLFPPGDSDALAGCLEQLGRDPALRLSLGCRARQHALAELRDEDMVEGYLAIYRALGCRTDQTSVAKAHAA